MIFRREAEERFEVRPITSAKMDNFIADCGKVYEGVPAWLDEDTRTINMAKSIASEIARLTTLGISIQVSGSARAEWMQKMLDNGYFKIREWVEYSGGYGTIILKPNGSGVDVFTPGKYMVTAIDENRNINGAVFFDSYTKSENDKNKFYTRLEYHRFRDNGEATVYSISNRTYVSDNANTLGDPIDILQTRWRNLKEDVDIVKANDEKIDAPLFGVLRSPQANNIDIDSPMGLPAFADALVELQDLDIAYSRKSTEIDESKRTVLLDSDRLMYGEVKGRARATVTGSQTAIENMKLPSFVKVVEGSETPFYQEINPTLMTSERIVGINNLLSQIGYKCGFSNGYFVLDQKTGMVTATQVEADDRRTIQLIKDWRDKLEDCMDGLFYALSIMADLYDLAPAGQYEVNYDFGDITYNREEDRTRWWGYVVQGKVPAWMYFEKFEGMTEEDAKAMIQEAQESQKMPRLFGEEE